jgi:ADP-dependent NAD(P)H-hydrate dehydratase / NAD(P)H-hydrate epimerase
LIPLLSGADTQALDREAEARGTPVSQLMERAGMAVARAAIELAAGAYGRRAVLVCGKGNNGGDGLVAARHLHRAGMGVEVFLLADPTALGEPAASKLEELTRAGIRPRTFSPADLARSLQRSDVAVDAIFGTGFRGEPEGDHLEAIGLLNGSPAPIVAVDVPSGVEGDTGAVRGGAVMADVTVALGAPKAGDVLLPGGSHVGVLEVADIGLRQDLLTSDLSLVEAADVRAWIPTRPREAHKRSTGVVLVVAGSTRMTGAPQLVAEGALRAGAGLVTVAVPEPILSTVQAGTLEPTFLGLPFTAGGSIAGSAWDMLAPELERFDAIALGPGLTRDPETAGLARKIATESGVPVVVDADAINAFEGRASELAGRRAPGVITPHEGEFARLFGMPASEIAEDRVGLVRKAASEAAGVVLLKGPHTLVARPDGEVRVNPTGDQTLATGGTGDVLTGAIAALLARGLDPADAASAAAYVHGLAGELAGREMGEGALAGDVAFLLPEALGSVRGEM